MKNPLAPHIRQALEQERQTLTDQEERQLHRILYSFPFTHAVLADLYYRSGCRTSEALIIRRHHLDSDACLVVFETLKQRQASPIYREVPIPPYLMEHLLCFPIADNQRLFDIDRSTALRWIKPIMISAGIPAHLANIKALRHCANQRGIRSNVEKRKREALLGHRPSSKEKTTNDHYGRLRGRDLRTEAMIMGGWTDQAAQERR